MGLALRDNPPELFLGSATSTPPAGAGTIINFGQTITGSMVSPEIFGPCPWAVALVGSRKEKTVARWMLEKDYPYFLPYLKEQSASKNTVFNPVFDGIIFFQSHTEPVPEGYFTSVTPREYEIRRGRHVFEILKTAVQVKLRREMAAIYADRTLQLSSYTPGEPIKVIDGPWKDFEGTIAEPHKDYPVISVRMEGMKTWAKVRIASAMIVKVPHD